MSPLAKLSAADSLLPHRAPPIKCHVITVRPEGPLFHDRVFPDLTRLASSNESSLHHDVFFCSRGLSARDAKKIRAEAEHLWAWLKKVRRTKSIDQLPIIFFAQGIGVLVVKHTLFTDTQNRLSGGRSSITQATRGTIFYEASIAREHSKVAEAYIPVSIREWSNSFTPSADHSFRLFEGDRSPQKAFKVDAKTIFVHAFSLPFHNVDLAQKKLSRYDYTSGKSQHVRFAIEAIFFSSDLRSPPESDSVTSESTSTPPEGRPPIDSVCRNGKDLCTDYLSTLEENCACRRVVPPLAGTASWLLSHREYVSWEDSDQSPVLWLHGKPGCGKSTLARVIAKKLRTNNETLQSTITAHFFFDWQAAREGRAVSGLLASLSKQLLSQRDVPHAHSSYEPSTTIGNWSRALISLRELLARLLEVVTEFHQVVFVIDALDNLKEEEVSAVLDVCRELLRDERQNAIRICLASRLPTLQCFDNDKRIFVDDENSDDIARYCRHEATKWASTDYSFSLTVQRSQQVIQQSAQGSFVWVSHVMAMLRDDPGLIASSSRMHEMAKTSTQPDFAEALRSNKLRIHNLDHASWMLAWLALATRPLTLSELHMAVFISESCSFLKEESSTSELQASLNLRKTWETAEMLTDLTWGMVRVIDWFQDDQSAEPRLANDPSEIRVHIVDQSAYEFLSETLTAGIHPAASHVPKAKAKGLLHLQLAQLSLAYLSKTRRILRNSPIRPEIIRQDVKHPLLKYAATSWLHHLSAANECLDSNEFGRHFCWATNEGVLADFQWHAILESCSQVWLKAPPAFEKLTFLHVAAYHGIDKALEACFSRGNNQYEALLKADARTKSGRTSLHLAAAQCHTPALRILLRYGADIKLKDDLFGNSIFHWISYGPSTSALRDTLTMLLHAGADVNECGNGTAPIALAAAYGLEDIVNFLLDNGADPDGKDNHHGQTALSLAIAHRRTAIAEKLLEHGATVNIRDEKTRLSPIQHAIIAGLPDLVRQLLRRGATFGIEEVDSLPIHQNMWLSRITLALRPFDGAHMINCPQNGPGASESTGRSTSAEQTNQNPKKGPKRLNQNDDDTDKDRSRPVKRINTGQKDGENSSELEEEYLCPYYVIDPVKHQRCRRRRWGKSGLRRMKQHLDDTHLVFVCNACQQSFADEEVARGHEHLGTAVRDYVAGFDHVQFRELHNRGRFWSKTGQEYWNEVWLILFPHLPGSQIPLPFATVTSEQMDSIVRQHEMQQRTENERRQRLLYDEIIRIMLRSSPTQLNRLSEVTAAFNRHSASNAPFSMEGSVSQRSAYPDSLVQGGRDDGMAPFLERSEPAVRPRETSTHANPPSEVANYGCGFAFTNDGHDEGRDVELLPAETQPVQVDEASNAVSAHAPVPNYLPNDFLIVPPQGEHWQTPYGGRRHHPGANGSHTASSSSRLPGDQSSNTHGSVGGPHTPLSSNHGDNVAGLGFDELFEDDAYKGIGEGQDPFQDNGDF